MDPKAIMERLSAAQNTHDLDTFLELFDDDYESAQPLYPGRQFGGREQVRENWSAIFAAVPDFRSELVRSAVEGDEGWAEWHWTGTRADGTELDMRGVTIFGVRDGRIAWGRLYMGDVTRDEDTIDEAVRRMAGRS